MDWGAAEEIEKAAKEFARAGNWPALWELACSVPIADAVRVVRRLPLKRWSPPDESGRALAARLAEENRRAAAGAVEAAAEESIHRLPRVFARDFQVSFAPGRTAMTFLTPYGGDSCRLEVLDLPSGEASLVYEGSASHTAVSCLGPREVVAIRDRLPRGSDYVGELVLYTDGAARVQEAGNGLLEARTWRR